MILQEIKNRNIIIVGSYNEYLRGIKSSYKDIDLVVTSFDEIPFKDPIIYSKVRRQYYYGNILIEVFLREKLPEWEYINNYKCATVENMIKFNSKCNIYKSQQILKRLKQWQQLQLDIEKE